MLYNLMVYRMAYDKYRHPLLVKQWVSDGGTLRGACRDLGVSYATARIWLEKYPEFKEAYELALSHGHAMFEERALNQLNDPKSNFDREIYRLLKANFTTSVNSSLDINTPVKDKLNKLLSVLVDSAEVATPAMVQVAANICDKLHTFTEVEELKQRQEDFEREIKEKLEILQGGGDIDAG